MLLALDTATPLVTVALHDGADVVAELAGEERLRHGEQLAPLVDRVLREAGAERFDVTAVAVGVGPGPYTGLRVGLVTARTLGWVLEVPVYGVCTLDVVAVEAAASAGGVPGGFVVATDARRKEVYLAAYDEVGTRLGRPRRRPPRRGRHDDPGGRRGAAAPPRALPERPRSRAPLRGVVGRHRGRGARGAARPGAALPAAPRRRRAGPPQAGVVTGPAVRVRRAAAGDAAAVTDLEETCLGHDAWSAGLLAEVVAGEVPTVHALVAEAGGAVVGYAAGSLVADVAELQRLAVLPGHRRRGTAGLLLDRLLALARDAGAVRLLLEVREDNTGALGFYAAAGFAEVGRRPRYYRDGEAAVVLERIVPAADAV